MTSRNKINFTLLFIFCMAVSVFSYLSLSKIKNDIGVSIQHSLQTLLLTIKESHQLLFDQRKKFIDIVAISPRLINLTRNVMPYEHNKSALLNSEALNDLRRSLHPVLRRYGDKGYYIISPNLINLGSLNDNDVGETTFLADSFGDKLDLAFSGKTTIISTISEENKALHHADDKLLPVLYILSPMIDEFGKVMSIIALQISPMEHYDNIAQLGRIGETGETYAFNQSGDLLTPSRFNHHLIQTNLLKIGGSSSYRLKILDPGGNLLAGYKSTLPQKDWPLTVMAQSATKKESGFNVEGYRDYRGVTVVGAWTWDDTLGFGLASEIDHKEAFKSYYNIRNVFIAGVASITFLGVFIVLFIGKLQEKTRQKILAINDQLEEKVAIRTNELEQASAKLFIANKELSLLAKTDALTKLANRRYFDESLNGEIMRAKRNNAAICILLFDVDYFKKYNDTYGHISGDKCLISIATRLLNLNVDKRPGDVLARYGGEEFVLLLNNANVEYVQKTAEHINTVIDDLNIEHKASEVIGKKNVTISVGYHIEIVTENTTAEALIKKADEALYQAKEQGRNQAVKYGDSYLKNSTIVPITQSKNQS